MDVDELCTCQNVFNGRRDLLDVQNFRAESLCARGRLLGNCGLHNRMSPSTLGLPKISPELTDYA
jgi:hypothetical protein